MADENELEKQLYSAKNPPLSVSHPENGGSYKSQDNNGERAVSMVGSPSNPKLDTSPRLRNGNLDTRGMSAEDLANKYEATEHQKKNSPNEKELEPSDREDENSQKEQDGDEENPGDDDSQEEGKEKGRFGKAVDAAKEAVNGAKQKVNDFKNALNDKKEKWKKVLGKAQKDDNWQKNQIPKWSKLLVRSSDDPSAKKALNDFEKKDKKIKQAARNMQMKMAVGGGSPEAAEKTMEDIKAIRDEMAMKDAPKIRRAIRNAILEKNPAGRVMIKLGLDRFVDMDNGILSKIFFDDDSIWTKPFRKD